MIRAEDKNKQLPYKSILQAMVMLKKSMVTYADESYGYAGMKYAKEPLFS